MQRVIGVTLALIILIVWLYISRFWIFDLWGRDGLFGIEALRPGGDLLRRDWLRGTMFRPYDLLIWTAGGFLLLTMLEKLWSRMVGPPEH